MPAPARQALGLCERTVPENRRQSEQRRSFLGVEGTPGLGARAPAEVTVPFTWGLGGRGACWGRQVAGRAPGFPASPQAYLVGSTRRAGSHVALTSSLGETTLVSFLTKALVTLRKVGVHSCPQLPTEPRSVVRKPGQGLLLYRHLAGLV